MRKLRKKLISAILLMGLILTSLSPVVVKAAGDGKITIENAKNGIKYSIYKVFDLTFDDATKSYTYTAVNEKLETAIKGTPQGTGTYASLNSKKTNKAGRMIIDETPLLAETGSTPAINPYDFSKWLLEEQINNLGEPTTKIANGDGNLIFPGLPLGYYLVKSSQGSIVSLTTTDKEVTIKDKNTPPKLEKIVSGGSVGEVYTDATYANFDEELTFKLEFTVQEYGNMDYILSDILPEGLEYTKDLNVTANELIDEDYTKDLNVTANELIDEDYTKESSFNNQGNVSVEYNGKTIEIQGETNKILAIKFPIKTVQKLRGKKVTVTYKAKLLKTALTSNHESIQNNENTASLQYDTLKTDDNEFGLSKAKASVRTTDFNIFKFKRGENETPLAGAKFKIYTTETEGEPLKFSKQVTDKEEYFYNGEGDVTEITTTVTGKFSIKGLKTGTYYIEETAAPDGFNPLQKRVKLEIVEKTPQPSATTATKLDYRATIEDLDTVELADNTIKIENKSGAELPETGGMGRTIIYALGAISFFGALILLIARKKVKEQLS